MSSLTRCPTDNNMSPQHAPRVYWLTETFFPPIVGGQEFLASHLTRALASRGADVSVITRQTEPPSAIEERIDGVHIRRISPSGILKGKGWRALPLLLVYLFKLLLLLIRDARHYDVVIVSGVKVMPLIVVPTCKLLKKKGILRIESYFELQEAISAESLRDMNRFLGRMLVAFVDRLRLFVLRRADHIIALSSEIRSALLAIGVPSLRVSQIPNAIDMGKFRPVTADDKQRLRHHLALPPARTLVIYLGRLSRAKGLPMLIEAWPRVVSRHPDLCLLVVGSGHFSFDNCEEDVRNFVRTHRLENYVRFLGAPDSVHEHLQASDLFVFPSEYEGFSLVLIEALACGLPVVVTSVGAAPELIQHGQNGFLFPPKSPEAMVAAIEGALEQRARWPAIGQAAHKSVTAFDLPAVTDQYVKLCHELLRDLRPTSCS